MTLESTLQEILIFAGTFNFKLVFLLFLICSIGELALFSIPYLLETVWLLFGYNLGIGTFTPFQLVLLWLAALAGRQVGAIVLYYLGRFGSIPARKLYQRYFEASLSSRLSGNRVTKLKFLNRIDYLSPFSVASGRLVGLRIPLTLTLGAKKQFKALFTGIVLSSLVWDGVYILLGLAGGQTALQPIQMIVYSLIGLTALYVITFLIRQLKAALA